jgi:hypothetical protein
MAFFRAEAMTCSGLRSQWIVAAMLTALLVCGCTNSLVRDETGYAPSQRRSSFCTRLTPDGSMWQRRVARPRAGTWGRYRRGRLSRQRQVRSQLLALTQQAVLSEPLPNCIDPLTRAPPVDPGTRSELELEGDEDLVLELGQRTVALGEVEYLLSQVGTRRAPAVA